MKKLIPLTFLFVLYFLNGLEGQVAPSIKWQKCLGGTQEDFAYSIEETTDGGFIVAGESASNDDDVTGNNGTVDYWITKISKEGNILWEKALGGSSGDYPASLHETSDGGFIVAGQTLSNDSDVTGNHGLEDYWVVKLDSAGNLLWQKCLGGSTWDYATSIVQTFDGGYAVAGVSESNDGDVIDHHGTMYTSDCWIVKLDSIGNLQWEKSLGGSDLDGAYSIIETTDKGLVMAGGTWSTDGDVSGIHLDQSGYPSADIWVVKLDSAGNLLWQKCLGGSNGESAYAICETANGGFIVTGNSNSNDGDVSNNHGAYDYWVARLDSAGNLVWQNSFGGSADDFPKSVSTAIDGGFIVAGGTFSADGDILENHGDFDYWILKLDSNGTLIWQKSLGGTGTDESFSVQQTSCKEFIIAGHSTSTDGDVTGHHGMLDNSDYWIVDLLCEFPQLYFLDADSDGYGNADISITDCCAPIGYVSDSNDCDDFNSAVHPGAMEICNNIDDNCNGLIDTYDSLLIFTLIFYADADSDGFGSASDSTFACSSPSGYVVNKSDCDDTNPNIHPGAIEIPNNGIDDDCDGSIDECSVNFTLVADSLIPHHYWLINDANGVSPITYLWNWGDGATDTAAYPSHTYDTAGFYNICLFIVDSTGCNDSICVGYEIQKSEQMLTIITVDVVDSIPDIATAVQNTNVLQSWSVFPNPASSTVFVNYTLSVPASVSIELFDVLGNKLQEMSSEVDAGKHHTVIDIREFSNGVYYLKIRASQEIVSKKITVVH